MSKMASGEPSDSVKKVLAKKWAGNNSYSSLSLYESGESDDDVGGGAPLYSPTEESHRSASPDLDEASFSLSLIGARSYINSFKISASKTAQPAVAPVNAQATQGNPVTSVSNDNMSRHLEAQATY